MPTTPAPDHLQNVLHGALGGSTETSPSRVASATAQAGAGETAENPAAAPTSLDPDRPSPGPQQAEETEAITPAPGDGNAPHPVASGPTAAQQPAAEADFATWFAAHAVPIGLIGLSVAVVAVALGSLGMKRARHRNEVMRRYRP